MEYCRRSVVRVVLQVSMTKASAVNDLSILRDSNRGAGPIKGTEAGADQLVNPFARIRSNLLCSSKCENVIPGVLLKWFNDNFENTSSIGFEVEFFMTNSRTVKGGYSLTCWINNRYNDIDTQLICITEDKAILFEAKAESVRGVRL